MAEFKLGFPVVEERTQEQDAVLLELTLRRGSKGVPTQVVFVFAHLGEDEELTRSTPTRQIVLTDSVERPVATLIRTALLDAKLTGQAAAALGVEGLAVRDAGTKILEQVGG